jgi:phage gp36-like protein
VPYATREDLFARFRPDVVLHAVDDEELEQWHPDAEARVDQGLQDAADEIDSYLGQRYSLPIEPVPRLLKKIAVDIAVYNILGRRGFKEGTADDVIVQRYEQAVRWLKAVAKGEASLPADGSDPGGSGGTVDDGTVDASSAPEVQAPERVFGRGKLKGW